ncbi:serine hydrolase-like protein isoform X1 [Maniola hyperantus]|uniref:serine hydrolase-like protein isoform X1 n=2 Tax=Aphantopus hyperantus TaxID=2795564 RepID=UPI00213AF617
MLRRLILFKPKCNLFFNNTSKNPCNNRKEDFKIIMSFRDTEKQVTIKAPWGNIAGLTWGESTNPPVLLCPGRIEPCSAFRPLVLELPQNFFYVAIDFPGNGFSDHFPKGLRFTTYDFIPTVVKVREHFGWEKFAYIGHSLGAVVGKFYNMAYPGRLTRIVDLDPIPAYHTVALDDMASWYKGMYGDHYTDEVYDKHTSGKEKAPKYTYQQVKEMFKKAQGLTDEAVECNLERLLEPAGDGLFRLTYDQRMKNQFELPFTPENLKAMYTLTDVPTLAIFAQEIIDLGAYRRVSFVFDDSAWKNGNYRHIIVPGNHDVHVNSPRIVAEYVDKFLLEGLPRKAKL